MIPERVPAVGEDTTCIAWRCEHCRKLQTEATPSRIVYIDEISPGYYGQGVKRHTRFTRRMVVCQPCRRSIGDLTPTGAERTTEGASE